MHKQAFFSHSSGIGGLALRCPHASPPYYPHPPEDGYLRPSFTLSIVPALNAGINHQTCRPARTSINADVALAAFPLSSIASDLIRQSPTKSQKISPSLAYFKKKQYLCSRKGVYISAESDLSYKSDSSDKKKLRAKRCAITY